MVTIERNPEDEDEIVITIAYADGTHGQKIFVNDDEAMDIMFELGKFTGATITPPSN